MPQKIILHTLRCSKNEDYFGKDECLLEIFADGQRKEQLRRDMDEGDSWPLNKTYYFNQEGLVKLWDEDSPDPNDFLGEVKVGTTALNFATSRFTQSGADYTLTYSVASDHPVAPPPGNGITHVTIELIDVYCKDTEDVTGADDFYLVGAVFDTQNAAQGRPILTKPIKINDGETKSLSTTVFDAPVTSSSVIYLEMAAYDEDFAKDWSQYSTYAGWVASAIGTAVGVLTVNPPAGTAVGIALNAFNQGLGLDKDDHLGTYTRTMAVKDLQPGQSVIDTWTMIETGIGFSTWNYRVRYKVTAR